MQCPMCSKRCGLREDEPQFYVCKFCGCREENNPTGPGSMWTKRGQIVAAPEAVAQQTEKAEKRNLEESL